MRCNCFWFDMTYADKLSGVFQRLHRAEEFEGTGIGPANVHRIIAQYGGRFWAEGKIDQGATFYFFTADWSWKMRTIFFSCCILLLLSHSSYAQKSNHSTDKRVLILHSQHETFHWTSKLNHAIKEEFSSAPFEIQLFIEYMDTRRFPAEDLFPHLRELYKIKYQRLKFDLILITDNAAFDFLAAYRNELFPQVPVVFCGLNNYTSAMVNEYKNITGILEDYDLEGTLELILSVQPEVKTIAVVSDASHTGRLHRKRFLDLKPLFKNRATLLDIASLDEQHVVQQIQKMPHESAVLVLSYHLDPHGHFFSVREGLEILQKGGRPLYSCWETSLGEGIIGGVITNARRHGRDAARMGIDILNGKKPADIPVQSCTNLPMFDYPYLEMFKINQTLLPDNSTIINKPDSFYIHYRTMIISVLSVFFVMSCLIVGLVINIIRRQRAEQEITWNLAINQALSSLYIPIVATGTNIQQLANIILHKCRQLTGSAHGFVAEIDPASGDLIAHTLTHMMQTDCTVADEKFRKIIFPQRANGLYYGLWGHALNTSEPFYTNGAMKHPASTGIPEGHIVIEKFLTVPVLLRGELVGQIATSNPDRPYTDRDLDAVKRIAEFYALAIQHKRTEQKIQTLNQELEERVTSRTAQLEAANKELEAFAYSVSHDLRAPLRHIDGFMELLEKKTETVLDEQGRHYMETISDAAKKMGELIDDLLSFSRMGRHALSFHKVALGVLVRDILHEFEPDTAGRNIDWRIGDLPVVSGDGSMLRTVLVNLISNALKFTRPRLQARIEIDALAGRDSDSVIFVRDNGVGFDMAHADKLFGVFQRLHRSDEFEGTGIGLANVRRIIARHGGRTWAESKVEQGATFYFALPSDNKGIHP